MSQLKQNTTDLDALIAKANALPNAGTGGAEPVVAPLNVIENGTYTAPDGTDGYSPITVNVQPKLQEKSVTPSTQEQEVTPDSGYDGMSKVNIGAVKTVEQATPNITVEANGLITAKANQSEGYVSSGEKSATEQLPTTAGKTITPSNAEQTVVSAGTFVTDEIKVAKIPSDYIKPTGTKSITENGTHDVTEFAAVNVNVPSEDLTAVLNAQETLISELEAELEGKAAGGGATVETCTIQYEVTEMGTDSGNALGSIEGVAYIDGNNGLCLSNVAESERFALTLNNVVCGTYVYLLCSWGLYSSIGGSVTFSGAGELISYANVGAPIANNGYVLVRASTTPNMTGKVSVKAKGDDGGVPEL